VNSFTVEPTFHKFSLIVQPAKGFRFSVDSVLLGHAIRSVDVLNVLELGAGSGIVSLLMASHGIGKQYWLVERDAIMCETLAMTIALNGLQDFFIPICEDVRNLWGLAKDFYDIVIFNPPFYEYGSGRGNNAVIGDGFHFLKLASHVVRDEGVIAYIVDHFVEERWIEYESLLALHPVHIINYFSRRGHVRSIRILRRVEKVPCFVENVSITGTRVMAFYSDGRR